MVVKRYFIEFRLHTDIMSIRFMENFSQIMNVAQVIDNNSCVLIHRYDSVKEYFEIFRPVELHTAYSINYFGVSILTIFL